MRARSSTRKRPAPRRARIPSGEALEAAAERAFDRVAESCGTPLDERAGQRWDAILREPAGRERALRIIETYYAHRVDDGHDLAFALLAEVRGIPRKRAWNRRPGSAPQRG